MFQEQNNTTRKRKSWNGARILRAILLFLVVLLACLVSGALAAGQETITGGHWLLTATTSRLFLSCAAVLVAALAMLLILSYALWKIGAPLRRRPQPEGGAAIIEFAMVMPILLMLVLLMGQSALLMTGNLCVHYAAFCAARSAIVQVPLALSDSEAQNVLADADSSAKGSRVKMSAAWALMPVSCGSEEYPDGSAGDLQNGLQQYFTSYNQATPNWVYTQVARRLNYAMQNTVVTIAPPAAPTGIYREHEDLVVNVEHTFYLSFPYFGRLFSGVSGSDGRQLNFGQGQYGVVIRSRCRLPNEGVRDYVDVEKFAGVNTP